MSSAHAVAAWSFEGCTTQASCGFERRSTGNKRQSRAFSVLNVAKDLRKRCHISPTAGFAPLGRIRSRNLSSTKWADLQHFDVSRRVLSKSLVQRVYTPRSKSHIVRSGLEYEALKGVEVLEASTSQPVELLSLWKADPGVRVVVPFLTHFADLSSWEFAQKLVKKLPALQADGVRIVVVGLGSADNARRFSETLNFPLQLLYADPTGACYRALNFSPGFAPDAGISPYLKLLPMLMGIGSPGTIQEVARGYLGDGNSKPVFEGSTPFDILGKGYQRPMELATLRLFNMVGILQKWGEMSPPETRLLTQQGGSLVFNGEEVVFKHVDSGILKYTDVDALVAAALQKKLAVITE